MTFGEQIRRYAEKQKRALHDVAAESIVDLSAAVIVQTPVDTGLLANNWQPTTDTPAGGIVDTEGEPAQMPAVVQTVAASIGGIYYLTNNLPYVRRVEYEGWSLKAPQGMLRVSIENYQKYLDNAVTKHT